MASPQPTPSGTSPVSPTPNTTSPTPVQWAPDQSVNGCQICQKPFSFFFRKHHCRNCGRVVCAICSDRWTWLLPHAGPIAARVDYQCHAQLTAAKSGKPATSSVPPPTPPAQVAFSPPPVQVSPTPVSAPPAQPHQHAQAHPQTQAPKSVQAQQPAPPAGITLPPISPNSPAPIVYPVNTQAAQQPYRPPAQQTQLQVQPQLYQPPPQPQQPQPQLYQPPPNQQQQFYQSQQPQHFQQFQQPAYGSAYPSAYPPQQQPQQFNQHQQQPMSPSYQQAGAPPQFGYGGPSQQQQPAFIANSAMNRVVFRMNDNWGNLCRSSHCLAELLDVNDDDRPIGTVRPEFIAFGKLCNQAMFTISDQGIAVTKLYSLLQDDAMESFLKRSCSEGYSDLQQRLISLFTTLHHAVYHLILSLQQGLTTAIYAATARDYENLILVLLLANIELWGVSASHEEFKITSVVSDVRAHVQQLLWLAQDRRKSWMLRGLAYESLAGLLQQDAMPSFLATQTNSGLLNVLLDSCFDFCADQDDEAPVNAYDTRITLQYESGKDLGVALLEWMLDTLWMEQQQGEFNAAPIQIPKRCTLKSKIQAVNPVVGMLFQRCSSILQNPHSLAHQKRASFVVLSTLPAGALHVCKQDSYLRSSVDFMGSYMARGPAEDPSVIGAAMEAFAEWCKLVQPEIKPLVPPILSMLYNMVNFPSLPLPSLKCVCTALLPVCTILPADAVEHIKKNSPSNLLSIMMGRVNNLAAQQQAQPYTGLWPVEYEVLAHVLACVGTIGVTVCQPNESEKAIIASQSRAAKSNKEGGGAGRGHEGRRYNEPGALIAPKIEHAYSHMSQQACETILSLMKQTPLNGLTIGVHTLATQVLYNLIEILPESYLLSKLSDLMSFLIQHQQELSSPPPQARTQIQHAVATRKLYNLRSETHDCFGCLIMRVKDGLFDHGNSDHFGNYVPYLHRVFELAYSPREVYKSKAAGRRQQNQQNNDDSDDDEEDENVHEANRAKQDQEQVTHEQHAVLDAWDQCFKYVGTHTRHYADHLFTLLLAHGKKYDNAIQLRIPGFLGDIVSVYPAVPLEGMADRKKTWLAGVSSTSLAPATISMIRRMRDNLLNTIETSYQHELVRAAIDTLQYLLLSYGQIVFISEIEARDPEIARSVPPVKTLLKLCLKSLHKKLFAQQFVHAMSKPKSSASQRFFRAFFKSGGLPFAEENENEEWEAQLLEGLQLEDPIAGGVGGGVGGANPFPIPGGGEGIAAVQIAPPAAGAVSPIAISVGSPASKKPTLYDSDLLIESTFGLIAAFSVVRGPSVAEFFHPRVGWFQSQTKIPQNRGSIQAFFADVAEAIGMEVFAAQYLDRLWPCLLKPLEEPIVFLKLSQNVTDAVGKIFRLLSACPPGTMDRFAPQLQQAMVALDGLVLTVDGRINDPKEKQPRLEEDEDEADASIRMEALFDIRDQAGLAIGSILAHTATSSLLSVPQVTRGLELLLVCLPLKSEWSENCQLYTSCVTILQTYPVRFPGLIGPEALRKFLSVFITAATTMRPAYTDLDKAFDREVQHALANGLRHVLSVNPELVSHPAWIEFQTTGAAVDLKLDGYVPNPAGAVSSPPPPLPEAPAVVPVVSAAGSGVEGQEGEGGLTFPAPTPAEASVVPASAPYVEPEPQDTDGDWPGAEGGPAATPVAAVPAAPEVAIAPQEVVAPPAEAVGEGGQLQVSEPAPILISAPAN